MEDWRTEPGLTHASNSYTFWAFPEKSCRCSASGRSATISRSAFTHALSGAPRVHTGQSLAKITRSGPKESRQWFTIGARSSADQEFGATRAMIPLILQIRLGAVVGALPRRVTSSMSVVRIQTYIANPIVCVSLRPLHCVSTAS